MTPAELADRIESLSWTARTASDKARARRLIKQGRARVASTIHETYIGKRGIVNYEAWNMESSHATK